MLKKVLIIILFLQQYLYSQTEIEWLNSVPGGAQINCFAAADNSTYYAAGTNSIFAKSNDAGKSWIIDSRFMDSIAEFRKMIFFNKNESIILGDVKPDENSKIYYSTDGGNIWNESNLSYTVHLNDWIFLDSLNGIATAYDEIYRTSDRGKSWSKEKVEFGYKYSQIYLAGDGSLIITGTKLGNDGHWNIPPTKYSIILRSVDDGITWQIIKEITGMSILDSYFFDTNTGIICCYTGSVGGSGTNIFYKTIDGGKTLVEKFSIHAEPITDLLFTTKNYGLATLNKAFLYTSTQGETWDLKYTEGSLVNYFYKGSQSTVYSTGGAIRVSKDNGYTWENITPKFKNFKGYIHVIDQNNLFSNYRLENTNGSSIIKTDDGGKTWKDIWNYSTTDFQLVSYPRSTAFFNSQIGISITNNSEVLRTDDGGNTWIRQTFFTDLYLGRIKIYNEKIAVIVASLKKPDNENGALIYTTDGGQNWGKSTITSAHLLDVDFADKATWYAVGYDGVFKSTDFGKSWSFNYKIEKSYLRGVSFATKDTGYAVGNSSNLIRTIDAGNSWVHVDFNIGPDIDYQGVEFWGNFGVIVSSTDLFITTDRGNSWSKENFGNTGIVGTVTSLFNNTCYLSGYFTTLRFSEEGSFPFGKIIESDLIDDHDTTTTNLINVFSLFQNYPNPFNGMTTIEYSLPYDTFYEITIYDILGRIIDKPIKQFAVKGHYKLLYEPINVSSGLYLYEIRFPDNRASKKMLYIK